MENKKESFGCENCIEILEHTTFKWFVKKDEKGIYMICCECGGETYLEKIIEIIENGIKEGYK